LPKCTFFPARRAYLRGCGILGTKKFNGVYGQIPLPERGKSRGCAETYDNTSHKQARRLTQLVPS